MTTSTLLHTLKGSSDSAEVLKSLKDLKNSVIGNTWKKVEVAEDEQLVQSLLQLLEQNVSIHPDGADIITETAVIIGAIANVGTLTIRSLLLCNAAQQFLDLVSKLMSPDTPGSLVHRLLPPVLRALRNIMVSTADLIWGHMWGVGAEIKVVGTGLENVDLAAGSGTKSAGKGKGVERNRRDWRSEASRALGLIFEDDYLSLIMSIIQDYPQTQNLLPLFQMLSRLIALPSHRDALARWAPSAPMSIAALVHSIDPYNSSLDTYASSGWPDPALPFIFNHLFIIILPEGTFGPALSVGRRNPKLLEAALDLLSALVQNHPLFANELMTWSSKVPPRSYSGLSPPSPSTSLKDAGLESEGGTTTMMGVLLGLLLSGPTGVRIAAAACLTNLIKAEKKSKRRKAPTPSIASQLLDSIVKLLQNETLEERVRLCFILSTLLADDMSLQNDALEQGCPQQVLKIFFDVIADAEKGELSEDLAIRSREATLLALSALSFDLEATRVLVSEFSEPPFLPYLLASLSHPSYGVRAAACQLVRALSRTVALIRTTLIDNGLGEGIIEILRSEVQGQSSFGVAGEEVSDEVKREDLGWTVVVTAMAVLCNMIADFSPLKQKLVNGPTLAIICDLTISPINAIAENALWTLKNALFRSTDPIKSHILNTLGYDRLRALLAQSQALNLQVETLCIVQNFCMDSSAGDMAKLIENIGEGVLLSALERGAASDNVDIRTAALGALGNLSLGNDRIRQSIIARPMILEGFFTSLNSKSDTPKVASLRGLKNLLESTGKTRRPRQLVLDSFGSFPLRTRVKELSETSPSVDVVHSSLALLDVLDRAKGEDR